MNEHRLNLIEDIPQSISQVICLRVPPGLLKHLMFTLESVTGLYKHLIFMIAEFPNLQ